MDWLGKLLSLPPPEKKPFSYREEIRDLQSRQAQLGHDLKDVRELAKDLDYRIDALAKREPRRRPRL